MTPRTLCLVTLPILLYGCSAPGGGDGTDTPGTQGDTPTATPTNTSGTPTATQSQTPTEVPTPTPTQSPVIIYTDSGDQVFPSGSVLELDVDGDGNFDVELSYTFVDDDPDVLRVLEAQSQNAARLIARDEGEAAPLQAGMTIGEEPAGGDWSTDISRVATQGKVDENPGLWGGPFVEESPRYLGMEVQDGTFTYYGWISLSVDEQTGDLTLGGYAYNLNPGQGIPAGDEG